MNKRIFGLGFLLLTAVAAAQQGIVAGPGGQIVQGGGSAATLPNNQPLQSASRTGSYGGVTQVTSGNVVQFGDLGNNFGADVQFYWQGNLFEDVNASGSTFLNTLNAPAVSINGSTPITGVQGNTGKVVAFSTGAAVGPACADANGNLTFTGCSVGGSITLTTTGTSGPATLSGGVLNVPQYASGGTGNMTQTGATVNAVPINTSTGGGGPVYGNSSISDNVGSNLATIGDNLQLGGYAAISPANTATGTNNYASNNFLMQFNYYNAGVVNDAYTWGTYVNSGTSPTTLATIYGPSTLPVSTANTGVGLLIGQNASLAASTANGNLNSAKILLRGATLNSSSASQTDDWSIQAIQGTGNQPTSTLTLAHSRGSTGTAAVSAPSFVATGGTPGIIYPCAAFATYPAASTVTGAEECVTDSTTTTWGATVTGGGTNNIQMRSNGTNWTVVGK